MRYRLTLVSLFAVAACGGDTPAAPLIPGALSLVRANGAPLPFATVDIRGDSTSIYAGALTLNPDGAYVREQDQHTRQPTGAIATIEIQDHGTWTQRGDSVFLTSTLGLAALPDSRGLRTVAGVRLRVGTVDYEFTEK